MASGDAVRLRAAVALLGSFPALAGASLDVDRGEVVLLQGANGAGKTTLLRVCAGLTGVVSGDVVVLGRDLVRDRRAVRRHVGLLHQGGGLYDDLTVSDNVRFAVRAAHGDPDGVEPALARLGLDGRLATVVIASHELERVTSLAHRTVVVAGGVVLDGRPAEAREPVAGAAEELEASEPVAGAAEAAETSEPLAPPGPDAGAVGPAEPPGPVAGAAGPAEAPAGAPGATDQREAAHVA